MSESSPSKNCPSCGAVTPANAPEGLCPKCLLLGVAAPTDSGGGQVRPAAPALEAVAAAFPQLEILEFIGQGGMGCVFKARQPQLNRIVALKVLPEALARDVMFATRFTREAQALAALSHPNIVTVHDFGQSGGFFYLLMEFVDGVNLRQALRAGRFTPEQALAIVPPICDALQFAHQRGIVHRDIKPENLLLDRNGRVKIADFGIAKMVAGNGGPLTPSLSPGGGEGARRAGEEEPHSQAAGTPHYMAPEQKDNPQRADHRADIYSLGVVLYEMLTGELPTRRLEPPSRKVQIDVRLDEVVLRALEKSPELRWQTAAELRTQVETITASPEQAGTTSLAAPVRASPAATDSPKTGKAESLFALGLFLAGTLGTLLLMTLSPRHELALIFGGAAWLLALVFGFMSWRERLSKVIAIATILLLAGFGITLVVPAWGPPRRGSLREQAEQRRRVVDSLPAVVVQTQPASGARNVAPGIAEIRVRFSKDMADGSWSWTTAWTNSTAEVVEGPKYDQDHRTCVMKVRLESGKTYAWWLNSEQFKNFKDKDGISAVPYLLIFQTRGQDGPP